MPVFEPVSAKNPLVPQLRRLSGRRSARRDAGRFIVEGATLLGVALDAGVSVPLVVRSADDVLSAHDESIAARAAAAGARLIEVPASALAKIADTVTPQPLLGVATLAPSSLEDLLARGLPDRPLIVLVGVSDPGNAGTILRSAEAAGSSGVVFCRGSVDPYNPKTVRSSAGSIFLVPIVDGPEPDLAVAALGDHGIHRVGTVARGGTPLAEAALRGPLAIVLGSEAHGLPEGLATVLDEVVTIPMVGRAESLNVAMAGTLVAFEAARRRGQARSDASS